MDGINGTNGQSGEQQIAESLQDEATVGYRPTLPLESLWMAGSDMPQITLRRDIEFMQMHPIVSTAMEYYKSGIAGAEFWGGPDYNNPDNDKGKAISPDPRVAEFVMAHVERFWQRGVPLIQEGGYPYGWSPGEHIYKEVGGMLVWSHLKVFHPNDAHILTLKYEPVGIRIKNVRGKSMPVELWLSSDNIPSKGSWYAHRPRFSHFYGRSQLMGAWRPWRRLGWRDGVEQVIDAAIYRAGYCGPIVTYPPGSSAGTAQQGVPATRVDGSNLARRDNRDAARQMCEWAKAGASFAISSESYPTPQGGGKKWEVQWPQHVMDVRPLVEGARYLEDHIMLGIGVPPELVRAGGTGSGYSGRSIPREAFLDGQQKVADAILQNFVTHVVKPLVLWNFGEIPFEISCKSLLQSQAGDKQGEEEGGKPAQSSGSGKPKGEKPPAAEKPPTDAPGAALAVDEHGLEHKGKGPGGGQFVAKGDSSSDSSKASKRNKRGSTGRNSNSTSTPNKSVTEGKQTAIKRLGKSVWSGMTRTKRVGVTAAYTVGIGLLRAAKTALYVGDTPLRAARKTALYIARERGLNEDQTKRVNRIINITDGLMTLPLLPNFSQLPQVKNAIDGAASVIGGAAGVLGEGMVAAAKAVGIEDPKQAFSDIMSSLNAPEIAEAYNDLTDTLSELGVQAGEAASSIINAVETVVDAAVDVAKGAVKVGEAVGIPTLMRAIEPRNIARAINEAASKVGLTAQQLVEVTDSAGRFANAIGEVISKTGEHLSKLGDATGINQATDYIKESIREVTKNGNVLSSWTPYGRIAESLSRTLGPSTVGAAIGSVAPFARMLPVAALGYIAYSAVKNPVQTMMGAQAAVLDMLHDVKSTIAKPISYIKHAAKTGPGGSVEVGSARFATEDGTGQEHIEMIVDRVEKAGDRGEWYFALLAASLDATNGDKVKAIDLADKVFESGSKPTTTDKVMSIVERVVQGITLGTDEHGVEHKGKGPGGGQFVAKGGGGSAASTTKPKKAKKSWGVRIQSPVVIEPPDREDATTEAINSSAQAPAQPPTAVQPKAGEKGHVHKNKVAPPENAGQPATREEHVAAIKRAIDKAKLAPPPTAEELAENLAGIELKGANKYRKDLCGNSNDRRSRKNKLMKEFGDGTSCPCVYCGIIVGEGSLEQDKILTTAEGGRYRMNNLVPSCTGCNKRRGDKTFDEAIKEAVEYAREFDESQP
jgi:hypothetical protein